MSDMAILRQLDAPAIIGAYDKVLRLARMVKGPDLPTTRTRRVLRVLGLMAKIRRRTEEIWDRRRLPLRLLLGHALCVQVLVSPKGR